MEDWIEAVIENRDLSDVFPVNAPADEEHAQLLAKRIKFLREKIMPRLEDSA
jgi:hypothetical protein